MNESHAAAYLPRLPSISLRTALISSSTSSVLLTIEDGFLVPVKDIL
jgi:hypothetical protein